MAASAGTVESSVAAGSAADLDVLYRRYGYLLRRRCRVLLRDHALADDALHEAFVNVMRHRERFAAADEPLRFLYRTVDNACFDQLRKRKRRREDAVSADAPEAAHPGIDVELRNVIVEMLAELDDDERTIAVCAFVDGMSQGDIADEIGLSRVTINKKIRSIRERARSFFEGAS